MTAPRLIAALHDPACGGNLAPALAADGIEVEVTHNMAETWNAARLRPPDAILLAPCRSAQAAAELDSLVSLSGAPGGPALFVLVEDPAALGSRADVLADFLPPSLEPAAALRRVRFGLARRDALNRWQTERARLLRVSFTDFKTGLANDRFLARRLHEECARATRVEQPLAALMIDFDDFKRLNDVHGHDFGDLALMRFADTLRSCLRGFDIAARIGGDEFCVLLPDTDAASATVVAGRLRALVQSHALEHEGRRAALTVSLGLAQYGRRPGGREVVGEPEALLRAADTALLAAKAAGKGRIRSWHELSGNEQEKPVSVAAVRDGARSRRGGEGPDGLPDVPPGPDTLPEKG